MVMRSIPVILLALTGSAAADVRVATAEQVGETTAAGPGAGAVVVDIKPPLAPPAPLLMPELVARSRFTTSLGMANSLLLFNSTVELGGSVALRRDVELFARLSVGGVGPFCIVGNCEDSAPGNSRIGARYVGAIELGTSALRYSPSVWGWLPTGAQLDDYYPVLNGLADSRAFTNGSALGFAIDVAWHRATSFVQLEAGAAVINDRGSAQIDNVFGAIGVGKQISATSLLAEWRIDKFPRERTFHVPGIGIGRDQGATTWRARMHPVFVRGAVESHEFSDLLGAAFAVDVSHRF